MELSVAATALKVVNCERVREAMSAAMDGELAAGAQVHVVDHLATCASCEHWQEAAYDVTRRARIQPMLPPAAGPAAVVSTVQSEVRRRRSRRYWLRFGAAVVAAGVLQLLATVPLLMVARHHTASNSRVDTIGLIELVIGTGFFVGALVMLWRDRGIASVDVVRIEAPPSRSAARADASDVA